MPILFYQREWSSKLLCLCYKFSFITQKKKTLEKRAHGSDLHLPSVSRERKVEFKIPNELLFLFQPSQQKDVLKSNFSFNQSFIIFLFIHTVSDNSIRSCASSEKKRIKIQRYPFILRKWAKPLKAEVLEEVKEKFITVDEKIDYRKTEFFYVWLIWWLFLLNDDQFLSILTSWFIHYEFCNGTLNMRRMQRLHLLVKFIAFLCQMVLLYRILMKTGNWC